MPFKLSLTLFLSLLLTASFGFAKGNGAPSGSHYGLNIIGVSKNKSENLTGGSGHRIFVPLNGKTKINLIEGDFAVLDANATDGSGTFSLPKPDPDNDGVSAYSVYARALGKPGGSAQIVTCATDPITLEEVCSTENLIVARDKGKSTFGNVTRELLYIFADLDGDGTTERYPLFDDRLEDYFWAYDNNGLRILQLRFYPLSTDINSL